MPAGARLWGLVDLARPPLAAAAARRFGRVFSNGYAARLAGAERLLQLAPCEDTLFAAPLLAAGVAAELCPAPGLAGAVARYWQARASQPAAAAGRVAVLTATPDAGICQALGWVGADLLAPTPMAALSPRHDRTLHVIGDGAGIGLLRRYGGDALLLAACPLGAYSDERVAELAEAELGRAVPVGEIRQWRDGIARPPALLLAEVARSARRLFVLSRPLADAIADRFRREATVVAAVAPPRVAAHAAGLWAEACVWAARLLADWALAVPFDVVRGPPRADAAVVVLAGMRGQALPIEAALAAAGGGAALIATRAVAEVVDLPYAAVLPDQPSPPLLAEAIAAALPDLAGPRAAALALLAAIQA